MKYVFGLDQYKKLFENIEIPKFVTDFDIAADIIPVDNFLRKIQLVTSIPSQKLQLNKDKRGPELINQAIISKTDADIDASLTAKPTDSFRLEKAWRLISSDLNTALKNKNVQFNNQVLADNILNDNGMIKFDFTFNDADSLIPKQKNGGKVPYKIQMLAGEIIPSTTPVTPIKTETFQILLELVGSNQLKKVEPVPNEPIEVTEAKWIKLRQEGWINQPGTYNWSMTPKATWINVSKESFDEIFRLFPKTYFKGDQAQKESYKIFTEQLKGEYIKSA